MNRSTTPTRSQHNHLRTPPGTSASLPPPPLRHALRSPLPATRKPRGGRTSPHHHQREPLSPDSDLVLADVLDAKLAAQVDPSSSRNTDDESPESESYDGQVDVSENDGHQVGEVDVLLQRDDSDTEPAATRSTPLKFKSHRKQSLLGKDQEGGENQKGGKNQEGGENQGDAENRGGAASIGRVVAAPGTANATAAPPAKMDTVSTVFAARVLTMLFLSIAPCVVAVTCAIRRWRNQCITWAVTLVFLVVVTTFVNLYPSQDQHGHFVPLATAAGTNNTTAASHTSFKAWTWSAFVSAHNVLFAWASAHAGVVVAVVCSMLVAGYSATVFVMWRANVRTGRLEIEQGGGGGGGGGGKAGGGVGGGGKDSGTSHAKAAEDGRHTSPQGGEDGPSSVLTEGDAVRPCLHVPHQEGAEYVHELFERTADRFPHLAAVKKAADTIVWSDDEEDDAPNVAAGEQLQQLTYRELERQANRIAHVLKAHVHGPDVVVMVVLSRDLPLFAAYLGVLKAGAGVCMVDIKTRGELAERMIHDAAPVAIITSSEVLELKPELASSLTNAQKPIVDVSTTRWLSDDWRRIPSWRPSRPSWHVDPSQALHGIIYTSGSTGWPKGVELCHAGYLNHHISAADEFRLIPGEDAASTAASAAFDASLEEWWVAWTAGCVLVVLTDAQVRLGADLLPILEAEAVTWFQGTPSLLRTLGDPDSMPMPLLRIVDVGGEAMAGDLVDKWTANGRRVINTYGPTEASIVVTRQWLKSGEVVGIGVPTGNVGAMVLDDNLQDVAPGVSGELCIRGVQLARCYRNQPDLTAEKFPTHPKYGRIYRTGDIVHLNPVDQKLYIQGRADGMVKIRGNRVELAAVDAQLCAVVNGAKGAAATMQGGKMVAFVQLPSSPLYGCKFVGVEPARSVEWREALSQKLPDYSLPTAYYYIDAIPTSGIQGKLDRRLLPDITAERGLPEDTPRSLLFGRDTPQGVAARVRDSKTKSKTLSDSIGVKVNEAKETKEAAGDDAGGFGNLKEVQWVHEIFESTANRYPNRPALTIPLFEGDSSVPPHPHEGEKVARTAISLTYRELESRANSIARTLSKFVTGANQVVALALPRTVDQYACLLGIMKAGGACLVLDLKKTPSEIVDFTLRDASPVVIIASQFELETGRIGLVAAETNTPTLTPQSLGGDSIDEGPSKRLVRPSWLQDPAICPSNIVYTSGTTGWPKGVVSAHSAYVNFHLNTALELQTTKEDRVAQVASLAFDIAGRDMYLAWTVGAHLIAVPDSSAPLCGPDLAALLGREKVTIISAVPSLLRTMTPEALPDLRMAYLAGEPLTAELVSVWGSRCDLVNGYGCSETPMSATRMVIKRTVKDETAKSHHWRLDRSRPVSIGRPCPGVWTGIFDGMTPIAMGFTGEICVGGAQVSLGYLGLPEKTAEAFVMHPEYGMMFRTGDNGVMREDAVEDGGDGGDGPYITFLGRADDQVKINGNRLELMAVDAQVTLATGMRAMVNVSTAYHLLAYIQMPSAVPDGKEYEMLSEELETELKSKLEGVLPSYAMPKRFIAMRALSETKVSKKADRKSLPDVTIGRSLGGAGAFEVKKITDPVEAWLLGLVRNVLKSQDIGLHDKFADISDSVSGAQLVSVLRQNHQKQGLSLGGLVPSTSTITIAHLFARTPTVHKLVGAIKAASRKAGAESKTGDAKVTNTSGRDDRGRDRGHGNTDDESKASVAKDSKAWPGERESDSSAEVGRRSCDLLEEKQERTCSPCSFTALQLCWIAAVVLMSATLAALILSPTFNYIGNYLHQRRVAPPATTSHQHAVATTWISVTVVILVFKAFKIILAAVLLVPVWLLYKIVGPVAVGVYPKWGKTHFRIWVRKRLHGSITTGASATGDSYIISATLRAFGATIGDHVHWDHQVKFGFEPSLLTVGDHAVIGRAAILDPVQFSSDKITCSRVHIMARAKLSCRAYVGPNGTVGPSTTLEPVAMLQHAATGANERWAGVPAERQQPSSDVGSESSSESAIIASLETRRADAVKGHQWSGLRASVTFLSMRFGIGLFELMSLVVLIVMLLPDESIIVTWELFMPAHVFKWLLFSMLVAMVQVHTSSALACAWLKLLGRTKPGVYAANGWEAVRTEIKLHVYTGMIGQWAGGVTFAYWMRFAGVTFHPNCANNELGQMHGLYPDVTTVGANSFWGHGCYTTEIDYETGGKGYMYVRASRFPELLFVGNKAVVEPGSYPTDCMIGVDTHTSGTALRRHMHSGRDDPVTIFGIPNIIIPQRDTAEKGQEVDEELYLPKFYQ